MFGKVIAISSLFCTFSAFADTTRWTNMSANGSGCPAGTSSVTAAGDEVAWVFSEFGYDLSAPTTATKFCRLSAVAHVDRGYYLARLNQVLSFGAVKSPRGSSFRLDTASRFFGYTVAGLNYAAGDGVAYDDPFRELTGYNDFLVYAAPLCRLDTLNGLFQSTVSTTGRTWLVGNQSGTVSVGVQGLNNKFSATTVWAKCP